MYRLRKGASVRDLLVDYIRKSLSTQTKIDQGRWMFGNLNWNQVNTKN
jgi:hypothetical protein